MSFTVKVSGAGSNELNGLYQMQDPLVIPSGFTKTCVKMRWNDEMMWDQLTNKRTPWFEKQDGAYIYYNRGDSRWWIDDSDGQGIYIVECKGEPSLPPASGYQMLTSAEPPAPILEILEVPGAQQQQYDGEL
eukprot:CAMPEP_0194726286 /NCGR_PEP_ID=MMETSP0296-20130528/30484_1 /TAXON_ID=39354 /ORGANISM="Heterosigma akashiwo, Strain CCMP2393" /LENGTH=131 /DNA_ID=CAMNT_0039631185 /DNA_START=89 /DNA_END=484 /DNA_ORIENTATION=+